MRSFALLVTVLAAARAAHASDATAQIRDGHVATGASYGGLVFDDPACKRAFGSHGKVVAAQRKKFGACLRDLLDNGEESAAMGERTAEVELETPTHGFEIVFTCGKHKGACYPGDGEVTSVYGYDRDGANAAVAGQIVDHTIEVIDAIKAAMAKRGKTALAATVRSCFRATGAWRGSHVPGESGVSAFDDAAARAVPQKITPYKIDGVAVPICVDVRFSSR